MSENFTLGEWGIVGDGTHGFVYCVNNIDKDIKDQHIICQVQTCGKVTKIENAYLISAAPEMYRNNEQTLTELEQMIPAILTVCAECSHSECKVCQFAKVLKTASEMERRIEQVQKKARGEE